MKRPIAIVLTVLALSIAAAAVPAAAQDDPVDRVTVELSNPSKPASLTVGLVNGGITVNGYDGTEVIVEARTRLKKLTKSTERSGKSAGMTKLSVNSSSLTIEEYRNEIEIGTQSWATPVDLIIKVPRETSLRLSCVNSGDIDVDGVTGEFEVSNTNGAVALMNIDGSAVVSAHNGDVTVVFTGIDANKDMSFSSFNGDVDVTFPAGLKAKVKLKNVQGEIYTDFQIDEVESPERIIHENRRDSGGKYEVKIDRAFWGTINGGGQEIQFSNFNGDIYMRKQK